MKSRLELRPFVDTNTETASDLSKSHPLLAERREIHSDRRPLVATSPWYAVTKRFLDIVVSLGLVLLGLPLFVLIAVFIAIDSPGPVIYTQLRRGRYHQSFSMYKFRTMRVDAAALRAKIALMNETDGVLFKIRNDSRITRVGKFLRKYSLDELPQLVNVLCGSMSLVGPRPFPIEDFEKSRVDHPLYERWLSYRHTVLPGLTGLWQVSGRNDLPFETLMRLDLNYVNRPTLIADLLILMRTAKAVITRKGAY